MKKIKKSTLLLYIFILSTSLLISCNNESDIEPEEDEQETVKQEYLISSKLVGSGLKGELKMIGNIAFGADLYKGNYDVNIYKLEYKTTNYNKTKDITTSGLIIVPSSSDKMPILSYQHGTMFNQKNIPSNYKKTELSMALSAIAGSGYILVAPDYIGYGASSDYPHPYEHGSSLASASIDMIKASKEFIHEKKVKTNDKLFLTGYSEGGYATMALHKEIEETTDWSVTMSAPAAGAYNKTAFSDEILVKDEDLNFLPEYMWVLDSYNWIYNINKNWNEVANSPYSETLESISNSNPMNFNSAQIVRNPKELFKKEFRNGVLDRTKKEFINALNDNNRFDWKPKYPITLYYGTEDDYVFPINSTTAYQAIKARGGTIDIVSYEGKNHETAVLPYLKDVYKLFEDLK